MNLHPPLATTAHSAFSNRLKWVRLKLSILRKLGGIDLPPLERLRLVRETFTGTKEYDNGKKALQA